jgi:hypothetical protein
MNEPKSMLERVGWTIGDSQPSASYANFAFGRWVVISGNAFYESRFAASVLPDQSMNLAREEIERDVTQHDIAPERFRQMPH